MLFKCVLSLFVVLIFNGLLLFSKGKMWHSKTKPKRKAREKDFSPIKRGMFGNLSCSYAFWKSKEKSVWSGLAISVVALHFLQPKVLRYGAEAAA